ncbi:mRNA endoribonuclease LsoA [Caldalkalibacillus thermarum]|uniref:type II toxin-antitoxin system RnlA family toxin n=1 Tax=Caldalkalibacillus thermarum TaxID=296745 RepID=UPI001667053F|nr:type II toxin-antitoxin system RnlA family toxin [Caldalkalibacillus thermarum]GGK36593.1 mRNA endoribonuclease LsoA [Caldalkalibacillus thermarum]
MSNNKSGIFKKLNMDRTKIDEWIRGFCSANFEEYEYNGIAHVNNNLYRCEFVGDGKVITVDFYFNQDGTTTINPGVGKHKDISMAVALYIRERLGNLADMRNFSYAVPRMKKENVDLLIEYLNEHDKIKLIGQDVTNTYTLYRFQSSLGDRITLKYYTNQTLQVQGKPLFLYQEITCFLAEFYPFDQLIDAQAEYFHIPVRKEEIKDELDLTLKYSKDFLGDTLIKMLTPSLVFKQIDIELDEYTSFVFPVLRVLEGYIKRLFLSRDYRLPKRGFENVFSCPFGIRYELRDEVREKINCKATCHAIERAYNYYHEHRHGLFHVEQIPEASRRIEDKREAVRIINKTLEIIEETYRMLPIHEGNRSF